MPAWIEWNPNIDEGPKDGPQDDTVIKRRRDPDDEEEDIPPHPGAPFGIPVKRRRLNTPPPMQMGYKESIPYVPPDLKETEHVPPLDGEVPPTRPSLSSGWHY